MGTDENHYVNLFDSAHPSVPYTHPTENEKPQPIEVAANLFQMVPKAGLEPARA